MGQRNNTLDLLVHHCRVHRVREGDRCYRFCRPRLRNLDSVARAAVQPVPRAHWELLRGGLPRISCYATAISRNTNDITIQAINVLIYSFVRSLAEQLRSTELVESLLWRQLGLPNIKFPQVVERTPNDLVPRVWRQRRGDREAARSSITPHRQTSKLRC